MPVPVRYQINFVDSSIQIERHKKCDLYMRFSDKHGTVEDLNILLDTSFGGLEAARRLPQLCQFLQVADRVAQGKIVDIPEFDQPKFGKLWEFLKRKVAKDGAILVSFEPSDVEEGIPLLKSFAAKHPDVALIVNRGPKYASTAMETYSTKTVSSTSTCFNWTCL